MKLSWILGLLLLTSQNQITQPFTLSENNETLTVVEREDFVLRLPGLEILDTEKLEELVNQISSQTQKTPTNATIDNAGRIIPEKVGYRLNIKAFREQFYTFFYENGPSSVEVPKTILYPKVDSEILSTIRTKRIGQYITYYNLNNKSRSHNIALAVAAINNYVLFPSEIFSFNKVVGMRTEEKGYMKAPEIVKGEFTEGIGGGICQVSSTLFNAVDRSGVKILERYSHSRQVPYVPPGRDATVSWYGPDFTFKNDFNQPILIQARAIHGKVVVFVYSSDSVNFQPRTVPGILQ